MLLKISNTLLKRRSFRGSLNFSGHSKDTKNGVNTDDEVTKESLQWRTPWDQRRGEWYSKLKLFGSDHNNADVIRFLQSPIDLSPSAIKRWWYRKQEEKEIYMQQYIPERNQILGDDLAAAHFIVHRGGSVKFVGENVWIKQNKNFEYNLPNVYVSNKFIHSIDCSNMALHYEGLSNLKGLKKLQWLSLNNCPYMDDWCMDRISGMFENNLQYLDVHLSLPSQWIMDANGIAYFPTSKTRYFPYIGNNKRHGKMKELTLLMTILILQGCVAPPVTKNISSDTDAKENEINGQETGLEDYMEYHRYLKEVVDALESDPQFREKLEKAEESDIRSGKIAHELEFVSHKVRSRLDEIKRGELDRLRHLASKQYDIENGLNTSHGKVGTSNDKEHIDHINPHTFEIEDLKKLIAKSTQDLAEADKKRREEFKEYEMQKEFEKQEKLKSLDDVHRVEMEKQMKEQEDKHKKHQPLHHPGSKQQLEEVWEKQDHMEQQDFDPRTFFMLHDLDGNGVWDQNEVKTLFIKELDKMYSEGAPEDDMRERIEEMERMREHVFNEVDQNKDGLISYEEFLEQTKRQDFQEDKGWEALDQQKIYTDEEYQKFEKMRMDEIERLIAQGMLPPHPGAPVYNDPRMQQPGQFPPQAQHHPGQVQGQYHPGQVPPQQAQYHPGQVPPQQAQYQPGQVPLQQAQYQPGQVPLQQAQYQPGQVPPQAQYHTGQVPQQQAQYHPGQGLPQQAQIHPQQGQAPPQQYHPNQVPPQPQQQLNQGQVPVKPAEQAQLPPLNTNEVHPAQGQQQRPNDLNQQQQQQEQPEQKSLHVEQNKIPKA
ncbi:Nucleobindin 1 [Carabus blaptoides fortunei]